MTQITPEILQDLTEEEQAELLAAQAREEDPDGDPEALDIEVAEEPSDQDPPPLKNDDAEDNYTDLEFGEDLGDDWDADESEEPV